MISRSEESEEDVNKSNTWGPRRRHPSKTSLAGRKTTFHLPSSNFASIGRFSRAYSSLHESNNLVAAAAAADIEDPWHDPSSQPPSQPPSINEDQPQSTVTISRDVDIPGDGDHMNSDTIHLALALYPFEGNPQYFELSFFHMDAILVVNTDGDDGWWEAYALGPIDQLDGITAWDQTAANVSPEVWSRLRDDDPLRLQSMRLLERWKDENWAQVELKPFGFVPAAYMAILSSISRDISAADLDLASGGDLPGQDQIESIPNPAPLFDTVHSFPTNQNAPQEQRDQKDQRGKGKVDVDYLPSKMLHRFHPFVTSGAEEYILTNCEPVPGDISSAISWMNSIMPSSLLPTSTSTTTTTTSSNSGPSNGRHRKQIRSRPKSELYMPDPITRVFDPTNASDNLVPSDVHVISSGPSWRKTPWTLQYSEITVSNPTHRNSWAGLYEWTVYRVTSTVKESSSLNSGTVSDTVCVTRRFNHFKMLSVYLSRKFPMLLVPDLPGAQFSGRFRDQFVRKRMRGLQRWINRIVRHPVLGSSEGVQIFLASGAFRPASLSSSSISAATSTSSGAGNDDEGRAFEESLQKITGDDPVYGAKFFLNVYHPEFNINPEEVVTSFDDGDIDNSSIITVNDMTGDAATIANLRQFMKESSKKVQKLFATIEKYRNGSLHDLKRDMKEMSRAWRSFSRRPIPTSPLTSPTVAYSASVGFNGRDHRRSSVDIGLAASEVESVTSGCTSTTHQSTLHQQQPTKPSSSAAAAAAGKKHRECCHRSGVCADCSRMTDAIQALAATYSSICDNDAMYAVDNLAPIMEYIDEWSAMHHKLPYLLQIHHEASRMGAMLLQSVDKEVPGVPAVIRPAHIAARLQTVFNVVHAELEYWFHRDRLFEWSEIVMGLVDAELERYQRSAMLFHGCKSLVSRSLHLLSASSELSDFADQ